MTFWRLIAALVLLLLNGVFVAVEFSLLASRRTKIEPLAEQGMWRARSARTALAALPSHLTACTIGVTVASLGLGAMAEPAFGALIEHALDAFDVPEDVVHGLGFGLAFALVVFLHLVVGELAPRSIALSGPERVLLALILPFRAAVLALMPFVWLLTRLAKVGTRLLGVEPREELATAATAEELAIMLAASRDEGLIKETAHELLSGALEFGDLRIGAAMVDAADVAYVTLDTSVEEAERLVVDTGLSRLPVAAPDLDHLVGFVHAKDLLAVPLAARARPLPLSRIRRRLLRVHRDQPLDDVLLRMRRSRIHVAAVEDDEHRVVGIATLEDVVENLVGDIRDESDQPFRLRTRPRRRPPAGAR